MKLKFEIPDEHAPAVLRFLASLMPATVEVTPDIAPGHPELPLGLNAAPEPAEDPTRRVLPWGDLPTPPEAPAGKVWVNRGTFEGMCLSTDDREVQFIGHAGWAPTGIFSTECPHIELIDSTF